LSSGTAAHAVHSVWRLGLDVSVFVTLFITRLYHCSECGRRSKYISSAQYSRTTSYREVVLAIYLRVKTLAPSTTK